MSLISDILPWRGSEPAFQPRTTRTRCLPSWTRLISAFSPCGILLAVVNGVRIPVMVKRLQAVGNSSGIIIDKPILELLRITPQTELDVSTDGERLIITPIQPANDRKLRLEQAQQRALTSHERTFRKLAK